MAENPSVPDFAVGLDLPQQVDTDGETFPSGHLSGELSRDHGHFLEEIEHEVV